MEINHNIDITIKSFDYEHIVSKAYAILPFTISSCGFFEARKDYFTSRQGLSNYLFLFTQSGEGYLEYGEKEILLKPNQAVLIDCEQHQLYKTHGNNHWCFKWIHLNGNSIKEFYELINDNQVSVINVLDTYDVQLLLNELFQLMTTKNLLIDIKINNILTNLLTILVENRQSNENITKYSHHKAEIETVISYIENNYQKKISIDELVDLIFISKYHFIRLFKTYTKVTPYEYIINTRINHSKQLLKDSNLSVNEVSTKVGFNNTTIFIKYFKRLTKQTPNKFRKYYIN